jgi:3-oxoacyl-[acyl-carrier protein] reductase
MTTQNGKSVVVTGASRGVGAAITQPLAAHGLAVIVNFAGGANASRSIAATLLYGGTHALLSESQWNQL